MAESTLKRNFGRLGQRLLRALLALVLLFLAAVLLLRFVPPPTSAFMLARYAEGFSGARSKAAVDYRWTSWKKIPPHMALAVVAAEDQKFPHHYGFDLQAIQDALEEMGEGGRFRGASTISQQVAKNLFLWKGRSFVRKGLEAGLTLVIESLWSKRRILEVYLNIAEFGDGIYGVEAASQRYFGKPAARLTPKESALLAAVLPNPKKLKAAAPSVYVRLRAMRIETQMRNLGSGHLQKIWARS